MRGSTVFAAIAALSIAVSAFHREDEEGHTSSKLVDLTAPAGTLPASQHAAIDGFDAAVLPTGRLVTPVGEEVSVGAPKAFGLDLSPDGNTLITSNDGVGPFSVTLIHNINSAVPSTTLIPLDATFMGVQFSRDGSRFYASGGEDGMIWVGDSAAGTVVALVNLNGESHPFTGPVNPTASPKGYFKGTFPGEMTLSKDGRLLYGVDQASFKVHVIDTTKIDVVNHGIVSVDPNNFQAVVNRIPVGRYPFGIALGPRDKNLFVGNVGIFQYSHLTPKNPTGISNDDYPLGYPAFGYPRESENSRTILIEKVDPRNLPDHLMEPEGIEVGYIPHTVRYTVPGLGSPNVS